MVPEVGSDWLEKSVIAGFRVWQLMFMSCAGATVVSELFTVLYYIAKLFSSHYYYTLLSF